MIDRIIARALDLRNRIHNDEFRFVLTPEHWKVLYVPENVEESNLATVSRNGRLKGYAAYFLINFEQVRAYGIWGICAEDEDTLTELIEQVVEKSVKDNVDFIFVRGVEGSYVNVLDKKKFSSYP